MPTRYEFGFGEGEIFRRRMERQARMFEEAERDPEVEGDGVDLEKMPPGADYYGFRGSVATRKPPPSESEISSKVVDLS